MSSVEGKSGAGDLEISLVEAPPFENNSNDEGKAGLAKIHSAFDVLLTLVKENFPGHILVIESNGGVNKLRILPPED